jgi:hypothetical protein
MILLMGGTGLRQGALKYEAKDAKNLLVFDPAVFSSNKKLILLKTFEQMGKRKIVTCLKNSASTRVGWFVNRNRIPYLTAKLWMV